jgi:hypothetical protein
MNKLTVVAKLRLIAAVAPVVLLLVAATLIYYATVTPGGTPGQTYTPPRMGKDGRIEPGQLK